MAASHSRARLAKLEATLAARAEILARPLDAMARSVRAAFLASTADPLAPTSPGSRRACRVFDLLDAARARRDAGATPAGLTPTQTPAVDA